MMGTAHGHADRRLVLVAISNAHGALPAMLTTPPVSSARTRIGVRSQRRWIDSTTTSGSSRRPSIDGCAPATVRALAPHDDELASERVGTAGCPGDGELVGAELVPDVS